MRTLLAAATTLVLLVGGIVTADPSAAAAACTTSSGASGSYSLTACLVEPAAGTTVAGIVTVSATTSISQSTNSIRMNDVAFCLDVDRCDQTPSAANYLMTSYAPSVIAPDGTRTYTFVMDSALIPDGVHTLYAVPVTNTDTLRSASLALTFANGTTSTPPPPTGFQPRTGTLPATGAATTFAAVGDGAGGEASEKAVTDLIAGWSPNLLLYLGDVYAKGSISEFQNNYDRGGYGRYRSITDPTIGNHEYSGVSGTHTPDGYNRYWASPPRHYATDVAGWHLVSLDANEPGTTGLSGDDAAGNLDPTSQYNWLKADLDAHSGACTVVIYHQPVFNTGSEPKVGFDPNPARSNYMQDIWSLMARQRVSLVLNGHDHNYQRFTPIDDAGHASATGVTEIISGGGGHAVQTPNVNNLATDGPLLRASGSFYGALRLTPHPDRMDFSEVNASNKEVYDRGSVPCQGLGPDISAPVAPMTVTGAARTTPSGSPRLDVSWTLSASPDDRAVSELRIRRDGAAVPIAAVDGTTTTWSDTTVQAGSTHSYTVTAVDAWSNESAQTASLPTTAVTGLTSVNAVTADLYVNSALPANSYGTATTLRVGTNSSATTRSYLKFDLSLEQPTITRAVLRVLPSTSSSSATITSHAVSSTAWSEAKTGAGATSWSNAPALGIAGAAVKGFTAGNWVSFDVTKLVTTNSLVSLALTQDTTGTAVAFNAREAGPGLAAQLLVDSEPLPDITPPTVPASVTATASGQAESPVTLAWAASTDDSGSVDHYVVLRDGRVIDQVPGSTTSYADSTVAAATTYHFAVAAVDRVGNQSIASAVTTASTATTLDLTPPDSPEAASSIPTSSTTAVVTWEPTEDNVAVTAYEVLRSNASTTDSAQVIATVTGTSTSWTDSGLLPASSYTYGIRAVDAAGNRGNLAGADTLTTPAAAADTTAPSTPGSFSGTPLSGTSVSLTWGAATDDVGVVGYVLQRGSIVVSPGPTGTATNYTDTGLNPAATYTYTLYAEDAAGNLSVVPASTSVSTPDTIAPTAPLLSVGTVTSSEVDLSWTTATDNVGVAGYQIYDGTTMLASTTATSFALAAQPSTTYALTVRAVDAAGNVSASSNSAALTTPAPTTYTDVPATITGDTYVKGGLYATSNYGSATVMRAQGGSTTQSAYLKFTLPPSAVRGHITRALLRVYAQLGQPGVDVSPVADTTWSEKTLSYNGAPTVGPLLTTTAAVSAAGWVTIDVTSLINGAGTYAFSLATTSTTVLKFSTKEWDAANPSLASEAPQLLVSSRS